MKLKLIPPAIALLGLGVASYLIWPERFGFCELQNGGEGRTFCSSPYEHTIGTPLEVMAITLLATSVFALLFTRKTFKRWAIFSAIYGVIITILLIAIPEVGYGLGGGGLTLFSRMTFVALYATLYVLISIFVFGIMDVVGRLRSRKN